MDRIDLGNNEYALLDEDDYEHLAPLRWHRDRKGYAVTFLRGQPVRMHCLLLNPIRGQFVDHINLDRLDNRRANLRLCSNRENQRNRPKPKTTAAIASRFKGVSWDRCNRVWRAKIVIDGRQKHLGTFKDEVEAARAYDAAAVAHFGPFARTNGTAR